MERDLFCRAAAFFTTKRAFCREWRSRSLKKDLAAFKVALMCGRLGVFRLAIVRSVPAR